MNEVQVRPFRRDDRDQVTDLVNAHISAVIPGVTASVNTVLRQLEREPGEVIVDRWVSARATLVAEQRGRVVAAAHLNRFADRPDVSESYRDCGEIRWVVCATPAPSWPDPLPGGAELVAAAVRWLQSSGARRCYADGTLPAPGVYGIPLQWPHIRSLLGAAGFVSNGAQREVVLAADLNTVQRQVVTGLGCERTVGAAGTRLSGYDGDRRVGYIEVDLRSGGERSPQAVGWADIGNLWVEPDLRRRGIGRWLLARATDWLLLGHVDRLLDYCSPGNAEYLAFLSAAGFVELAVTDRDWELRA